MSMSSAELEAFLAQTFPTPLGVIATLRSDGSPHIVPVSPSRPSRNPTRQS